MARTGQGVAGVIEATARLIQPIPHGLGVAVLHPSSDLGRGVVTGLALPLVHIPRLSHTTIKVKPLREFDT